MRITLHYNSGCPDCERQAKRTARLDWLRRVELSTDRSPLGEVPVGEIVVVDKRRSRVFTGMFATRKVCMQVPLLVPYGLLLHLPWVHRIAGERKQGCNGDSCEISTRN